MTDMAVEEDIDLEALFSLDDGDTPPCTAREGGHLCGKPSVTRVYFKCACNHEHYEFLCQGHLDSLKRYDAGDPKVMIKCNNCGGVNNFTWREA